MPQLPTLSWALSIDCARQSMDPSIACQSIDSCTILKVSNSYSRLSNPSIAQPEQSIDHYPVPNTRGNITDETTKYLIYLIYFRNLFTQMELVIHD